MTTEATYKKTVCVDLDGTLLQYDTWKGIEHLGDPIPGAVEFTKALGEFAIVVIWTTRLNPQLNSQHPAVLWANVKEHLDKHGFHYDTIWSGPVKPLAAAFIDDRAIPCSPQRPAINIATEYKEALEWARYLATDECKYPARRPFLPKEDPYKSDVPEELHPRLRTLIEGGRPKEDPYKPKPGEEGSDLNEWRKKEMHPLLPLAVAMALDTAKLGVTIPSALLDTTVESVDKIWADGVQIYPKPEVPKVNDKKVPLSGKPADPECVDSGAPQPIDPATGMYKDYWVLSEEERRKGFVRPVREAYTHVGIRPKYPLRDLTPEEHEQYDKYSYVKFEDYQGSDTFLCGRYWTQAQLDSGCGTETRMALALAETYARDPKFYGATFCCGCRKHFPVSEFRWKDGSKVGS